MPTHPNGNALWQRSEKVLAGGPGTLSKHPSRYPEGIAPKFLSHGHGAYVWDVDGFKYIDTVAALGPILLGHDALRVTEAVRRQVGMLSSSTLSTALEVEVAEMLVDMVPGAERCRFATNGADVTNAAIKIARHMTGRRNVLFCGYHGGHDSYLSTTDKNGGILSHVSMFNCQVPWGNMMSWNNVLAQIDDYPKTQPWRALAAIIVEVPPRPYNEDRTAVTAMLQWYKEQAHRRGALFIMDEIVTGLRYGIGGAQAYYGVQADIICMSKALGNGYPIAAILGSHELLKAFDGGEVFLSTTFGANCIGLAACKATLETLRETDALKTLEHYGSALVEKIAELFSLATMPCTIRGNYARFVFDWEDCNGIDAAILRTLWLQELCRAGVLANIPWFPMCSYDENVVNEILHAVENAVRIIGKVIKGDISINDVLECEIITDVFQSRYSR